MVFKVIRLEIFIKRENVIRKVKYLRDEFWGSFILRVWRDEDGFGR